MKKVILLFVAGVLCAGAAQASEYAAFTRDLVQPYDFYKKSLSLTSKKEDAEKAKVAIASFIDTWDKFSATYAADVPKPFAGISDFSSQDQATGRGRQAGGGISQGRQCRPGPYGSGRGPLPDVGDAGEIRDCFAVGQGQ